MKENNIKNNRSTEFCRKFKESGSIGLEFGVVHRVFDPDDENYPTIGLTCNEYQALLLKRLIGTITRDEFRSRGFSDEEASTLEFMYGSI